MEIIKTSVEAKNNERKNDIILGEERNKAEGIPMENGRRYLKINSPKLSLTGNRIK